LQLLTEFIHNDYKVIYFSEINSTNEYAWNLISNSNPNTNIVVITGNQTQGKGQYDRIWDTEPNKNITMSVIMAPSELNIKDAFHLNIVVSVSILKAINRIAGFIPKVKWPNDIYHNNDKLGGILIKNKVFKNQIKYTVIGIGLNVNQINFDTSIPNPMSIKKIIGEDIAINLLIEEILNEIICSFETMQSKGIALLHSYYLKHLFAKNELKSFKIKGEKVKMSISNVEPNGKIQLKDEENKTHFLTSGLEYILR